jgi:hypothetical protein
MRMYVSFFLLKFLLIISFIQIVDVYTKDFQRTIAILSGEFIVKGQNLVDQNRTIYWQMALALHLW